MLGRAMVVYMMLGGVPLGWASGPECTSQSAVVSTLEAVVNSLGSSATLPAPAPEHHRPESSAMREVYDANEDRAEDWLHSLSGSQTHDLEAFLDNWKENKSRYEAIGTAADLPPELVAALHWRESTADFSTYLHQGDPLGKPAVNVPTNIPVFTEWDAAAIHALGLKSYVAEDLDIDNSTQEMAALATYAEYYNGLGYSYRDKPSPYVWSGTDQYKRGKYVSDGRYSAWAKDGQLGVVVMIQGIRALEAAPVASAM